jgi:sugar phosphate isomerase/epimerase
LGAGAAVFHTGAVVLEEGLDPRGLNRLVREGKRETPAYEELRQRVAASRQSRAPRHLDTLLSSLDRLAGEAARRRLVLGIENRYHPEQIPTVEELESIFRALAGAPLGYWHDTGHAASLVTLGFLESQTAPLEAFRGHIAGFHLHDAMGLDDHLSPGEGDLDFAALAPFVTAEARLVLETHPPSPPEAVARAAERLAEAGIPLGR